MHCTFFYQKMHYISNEFHIYVSNSDGNRQEKRMHKWTVMSSKHNTLCQYYILLCTKYRNKHKVPYTSSIYTTIQVSVTLKNQIKDENYLYCRLSSNQKIDTGITETRLMLHSELEEERNRRSLSFRFREKTRHCRNCSCFFFQGLKNVDRKSGSGQTRPVFVVHLLWSYCSKYIIL